LKGRYKMNINATKSIGKDGVKVRLTKCQNGENNHG
jgi:hypothetical protein